MIRQRALALLLRPGELELPQLAAAERRRAASVVQMGRANAFKRAHRAERVGKPILLQQQLAKAGVTVNLQKVDPSQSWDMLVAGEYDISVMYWTNDILDPDQKTTFVLGHDANMNYMTRYHNDQVKALVAAARVEMDSKKREQMYIDLQKMAKADVNWVDLYYSPYRNVSRKNIDGFYQNPLGRFFLEDTVKH